MLRGCLDVATHRRVAGWAWDEADPDTPVGLLVMVDGTVAARVLAEDYRPDLVAAGFGSGRCGFDVRLAPALPRDRACQVAVVRDGDGAALQGSPMLVPRQGPIEEAMRDALEPALCSSPAGAS